MSLSAMMSQFLNEVDMLSKEDPELSMSINSILNGLSNDEVAEMIGVEKEAVDSLPILSPDDVVYGRGMKGLTKLLNDAINEYETMIPPESNLTQVEDSLENMWGGKPTESDLKRMWGDFPTSTQPTSSSDSKQYEKIEHVWSDIKKVDEVTETMETVNYHGFELDPQECSTTIDSSECVSSSKKLD